MDPKPYNVLFICTDNSARSIIAEALLNHIGGGRFRAYSAGVRPKDSVHPLALQELDRLHVRTDDLRSKSWEKFVAPGAPQMDLVFTLCSSAAGEACPAWPGQPLTASWNVPDPAAVEGSDEVRANAFRQVTMTLKRRLDFLTVIPSQRLEHIAIHREVDETAKA